MITTFDGVDQLALHPGWCVEQDWYPCRTLFEGLSSNGVALALMRFEEIERHPLLAFAKDVQGKGLRFFDNRMGSRIRLYPQCHQGGMKRGLRDPVDSSRSHRPILPFCCQHIQAVGNHA